MTAWSQTWTYYQDGWREGNVALAGPRTHAMWLGSSVFDGARGFEGVLPDLDAHCMRVNQSALALGLAPTKTPREIAALAVQGYAKFSKNDAVYVRPMYWAEHGGYMSVPADPDSTQFCLCIYETPMPEPTGFAANFSEFRRPTLDCMPVNAKSGCLYPNNGRAIMAATAAGFDNAILCDALGNVAEFATANLFIVKDGVVRTPAANGCFLAGVTRSRIMNLLHADGYDVQEATLTKDDVRKADEIFASGNYSKVMPLTRLEGRHLQIGPVARRARELYWAFAHGEK